VQRPAAGGEEEGEPTTSGAVGSAEEEVVTGVARLGLCRVDDAVAQRAPVRGWANSVGSVRVVVLGGLLVRSMRVSLTALTSS
jgi:hypothetical protein